jgi:hypothetical protein
VLSAPLTTGSPITSLPVNALAFAVLAGSVTITSGANTQSFTTTGAAASATSIPITSATPNYAYPTTSTLTAPATNLLTLQHFAGYPTLATATVTGATVTLYNRDKHIRVIGGTWNRGAQGGSSEIANVSILLRHVDDVEVDVENYIASTGKECVHIGDLSNFRVRIRDCNVTGTTPASFQGDGPLWAGDVDVFAIYSADDILALNSNWTGLEDTAGDIVDATFRAAGNGGQTIFKVISGAGYTADGIINRGIITGTPGPSGFFAWVGNDTGEAQTTGGNYGLIDLGIVDGANYGAKIVSISVSSSVSVVERIVGTVRNVASGGNVGIGSGSSTATIDQIDLTLDGVGANSQLVNVTQPGLTINNFILRGRQGSTYSANYILSITSGTIGQLAMRDFHQEAANAAVVLQVNGGTVNQAVFDACTAAGSSASASIVAMNSGTLSDLILRDCQFNNSGGSYLVSQTGGTLSRLRFSGGSANGWGALFHGPGSGAGPVITFSDGFTFVSGSRLVNFNGMTGCMAVIEWLNIVAMSSGAFYTSGGSYRVIGGNLIHPSFTLCNRAGSESISVDGASLPQDVSLLTPTTGDMALNQNASTVYGERMRPCSTTAPAGARCRGFAEAARRHWLAALWP